MIVLSVLFHGVLFMALVLSSTVWPERTVIQPVRHVKLVDFVQEVDRKPAVKPSPRPPQPQPPRQEAEPKPEPKPRPVVAREKNPQPASQKPKPQPPKAKETTPRPEPKEAPAPPAPAPAEKLPAVAKKLPEVEKPQPPPLSQEPPMAVATEGAEAVHLLGDRAHEREKYHEFAWYLNQIARKIKECWAPPPSLTAGQRMEAVVEFRLTRSGRKIIAADVKLLQKSGNVFYDQAAFRATYCGEFPPLPDGYPEELRKIKVVYVLDAGEFN